MPAKKPVKLAILWHMHQPYYISDDTHKFQLPWVRLHALKDYLDMPLLATKYEHVKTTFNLVPSLIDQFDMYSKGIEDHHLTLSKIRAEDLNKLQKHQILNTFFSCPKETMIEPYPRYLELFNKYDQFKNIDNLLDSFIDAEIIDLQVWANLVWIDPLFRSDELIKYLFSKSHNYSENDKNRLLEWQINHISSIIPNYKSLLNQGKIDISFSPYYHPILPLLIDSESAKETLPNISLPQYRFNYPIDAEKQITMAQVKFESLFEKPLAGMWPSEGSVSEKTVEQMCNNGIKWIATDEKVLFNSYRKNNLEIDSNQKYRVHVHNNVNIFFRDHFLSDKIGFEYSRMDPEMAVKDFMRNLYHIRKINEKRLDDTVVAVILDGENAWEYYKNDGYDFLDLMYSKLDQDELVETITFTDASNLKSKDLRSISAGSWINGDFKIWIGHPEDNKSWDLLYETRKVLTEFEKDNPNFENEVIKKAWKLIYIAEGSDWCWWYGDEHRGYQNDEFDLLFRTHLIRVYEILKLPIPDKLRIPIHQTTFIQKIIHPENFIAPKIDGKITHFYEWNGSGYYNHMVTSGAMHRSDKIIKSLYFGFDENNFYIRLDFVDIKNIKSDRNYKIRLSVNEPVGKKIEFYLDKTNLDTDIFFEMDEICELKIPREFVIDGINNIEFQFDVYKDNKLIDKCPEFEPIRIKVPKPGDELFWPI